MLGFKQLLAWQVLEPSGNRQRITWFHGAWFSLCMIPNPSQPIQPLQLGQDGINIMFLVPRKRNPGAHP